MVDKATFMETLHSVQEIAKASPEPMTKEEIRGYFQDMDLSEEQQEMVYQFLLAPPQEQEDFASAEEAAGAGQPQEMHRGSKAPKAAENSKNPHFQMYLREISAVASLTKEQQNSLYVQLLAGQERAVEELSHQWLKKIIRMAEEYVAPKVLLEDLVQEGNISLLLGLRRLLGKSAEYGGQDGSLSAAQQKHLERRLEELVREGMQQYRQDVEGQANGEDTVLAKVSLVYEARKALAEENGTDPTVQELCEYTRIPPEEIADILSLHEKARNET